MVKKLVDLAAMETLERIRHDKKDQSRLLQTVLTHIESNLFRKELTVAGLGRASGVSERTVQRLFRRRLLCTPWSYIRDRRMEVATELFASSDLRVWQIVEAVGYSTTTTFSTLFTEWAGISLADYLQAKHRTKDRQKLYDRDFLGQLNRGEADREQAEWAAHYLEELYGLQGVSSAPESPNPDFYDEVMAEMVWSRLREKPFAEQRELLRQQYACRTPALFNLLSEKSREEVRRLPGRAVELMELALTSLDATAWVLGGDFPELRARGCACLGNALRRALDFPGAEEAFDRADEAWQCLRARKDQLPLAEIWDFRGALRGDQCRFHEALGLANQAVKVFRAQGTPERLAEALIGRATIVGYSGEPEATIADLKEARQILDNQRDASPHLRLAALLNLTNAYALTKRFAEAEEMLPKLRALTAVTPDRTGALHLRWTTGLVAHGRGHRSTAEACFRDAVGGFRALGESGYAAAATLELAVLCSEESRDSEAIELAAGTIPVFEAFGIRREAVAAIDLIHEAGARSSLSVPIAQKIRAHLLALRQDPLFAHRANVKTDERP
ncbi:MAG: helix-turn-helix domain-containing protein [bacterium]|nr:helix-turn-helix domain-containing protein [bacterium]